MDSGYTAYPGAVIENIAMLIDGTSRTAKSGTYSAINLGSQQTTTTSYADVVGSDISYTPPAGTRLVIYRYHFSSFWTATAHSIQHFKFFIDGVEVLHARHNRSRTYYEGRCTFEWPILIGGTPNSNTGRLASWTTAKILKMQTRRYGSNSQDLFSTVYWDGAGSSQFNRPMINIIAIA
jgi:hypothetical protein